MHRLPADEVGEPTTDPVVGRMFDAWLVMNRLGHGGVGTVYLAEQQPVGLRGALKMLTDHGDGLRSTERFMREAAALARLSHPHIVRLMAYGVVGAIPYLVMEFVRDGRTLGALADQLDMRARRRIIVQITHALEAAHGEAIVHRDLKPDNVMLQAVAGDPHFVRLVDFGLAKFTDEGDATALAAGTPRYMAPEQALQRDIGPWTDVYATGVIACELFTGHRPFKAGTVQQTLLLKLDADHDPLAGMAEDVPPALAGFLRRAMARDPRGRFPDAAALRAALPDLETLMSTGTGPTLAPTVPIEPPRVARRWTGWAAGLVGIGGLGAALLVGPGPDDPRPDAAPLDAARARVVQDAALPADAALDAAPDAVLDAVAPDGLPLDVGPDAARRPHRVPPRARAAARPRLPDAGPVDAARRADRGRLHMKSIWIRERER